MYFMPPDKDRAFQNQMHTFKDKNAEDVFKAIEPDVIWMDIQYGDFLLFTQNNMHGNRVNEESETRWSMNCRFKSVFSPYADKKLGEFFEPITLRPATRLGMDYRLPEGIDG